MAHQSELRLVIGCWPLQARFRSDEERAHIPASLCTRSLHPPVRTAQTAMLSPPYITTLTQPGFVGTEISRPMVLAMRSVRIIANRPAAVKQNAQSGFWP